jgi:hypothetical protein
MKKTLVLIDFQFTVLSLIILCTLFTPIFAYAGTFCRCTDKNGNEIITDCLSLGKDCKPIVTFKERTDQERMDYEKEKEEKRTAEYEKMRAEDEKIKADENKLDECFQNARKRYNDGWAGNCRLLYGNPGCALPTENAQLLGSALQEDRKMCLKLYPQNPNP